MNQANPVTSAVPRTAATSSHTRLIEVIDALVRRMAAEPWGVRELAAELNESRSTVNRLLLSLVERGFASEVGTGKYSLGPRLKVLAHALNVGSPLLHTGDLLAGTLVENAGCTAMLSVHCAADNGYFVTACSESRGTLSFRPEPGVIYPLEFGDIGRAFSDYLRIDRGMADNAAQPPYLAESEFPRAMSIVVRTLSNGLTLALSLHSFSEVPDAQPSLQDADVDKVLAAIDARFDACCAQDIQHLSETSTNDAKSTIARLERLVQMACACPNGFNNGARIHDHLMCNGITAKRFIQSATQEGLLSGDGTRLFPGPKLYQWAARITNMPIDPAGLCRSILQTLVQDTGETVAFLSYDAHTQKAQFLEVLQGWRPIQYKLQTHVDVPLYAGAAGKAVLAWLDPALVETLQLVAITEATITRASALVSDLSAIRQRGWATGDGERVPGAFGLAVPYFIDGEVRGSISATIPQYRKDEQALPHIAQRMLEAARQIENLLSVGVTLSRSEHGPG
ncbi:IclR family transcriptional regulator domain-containing protein [Pseudomonas sp. Leaf127]|uniref:IclR family transcriptional regulator domain-containing protein n=1 Tax=Pseudomonas sp. Leaf127 TaxID=1736267 RepID=UPI0009EBBB6B|nr:IclR family transcriptional regulator C-terminal domain-containing protein [Pseudomonas sp. Leaf127]